MYNDVSRNSNIVHIVNCCLYDLEDNKGKYHFTGNKLIIACNFLHCKSNADLRTWIKVTAVDINRHHDLIYIANEFNM